MNIQDKMQEIHHKYGVTEKANYEIQLFVEALLKEQKEQLILSGVRFELPDTKEIESRLKHVVDESFEDYEVVEKREYSLGFRACFNWLKIKQMKSKGN